MDQIASRANTLQPAQPIASITPPTPTRFSCITDLINTITESIKNIFNKIKNWILSFNSPSTRTNEDLHSNLAAESRPSSPRRFHPLSFEQRTLLSETLFDRQSQTLSYCCMVGEVCYKVKSHYNTCSRTTQIQIQIATDQTEFFNHSTKSFYVNAEKESIEYFKTNPEPYVSGFIYDNTIPVTDPEEQMLCEQVIKAAYEHLRLGETSRQP